jgi:sugar-1,4-lactone oxidase-like protein
MAKPRAFKFTNWAGNFSFVPEAYLQPASEEELIKIVRAAASQKKNIRVVGAGHSWSQLVHTLHTLVNLDKFNKVISVDTENETITVQAGIRLKDLSCALRQKGMCLSNLGSVSEQSIAGAISTGTHGTGIQFGCLATQVISLKLLTASGEILFLTSDDELFKAVAVSFGTLGIITELTLKCSRAFNLKQETAPMLISTLINETDDLKNRHSHTKTWWFPHTQMAQFSVYSRTNESIQKKKLSQWFDESILSQYVFKFLLNYGLFFPSHIPRINNFINFLHLKEIRRTDLSEKIFNVPMPPKHRESEYAIPAEKAQQALAALKKMIEEQKIYVNFVIEVRYVKGDDFWLSPCYGRDTCFIGAYLYGNKNQYWSKYLTFFEELMLQYGGRPHWGKEFSIPAETIALQYPKWEDFLKLRQKLDPENLFSNKLTSFLFADEKNKIIISI